MTTKEQTETSKPQQKNQQKFYKKRWFWAIIIIVGLIGIASPKDSPKKSAANPKSDTSATTNANEPTRTESEKPVTETKAPEPAVPAEYKSALAKATSYSNTMYMSKQGLYDQLTSDYGEKFTAEAAQYAIDNVKADWNANALAKAKNYQDTMQMSPAAIRDQLVSQYGEKFLPAEADYAVEHLSD